MRARIVFLVRVPAGRREDFLAAYEKIRYQVSGGVPGHLGDQVCQSATDPAQWLITSEWRGLADFLAWEAGEEHRELVRPLRECVTEARSLRFLIRAETAAGAPVGEETGTAAGAPFGEETGRSAPPEGEAGAPVGEGADPVTEFAADPVTEAVARGSA
ncbi:antibiotic biosynthesis monooxygenase family protein [Streptosporangium sp. NPDC048865]|uniref:antibiotic biosynthesis monooxygenase family protein n=1 Tax=Streptosporangium sp. NPDC048865 TaxID=3155766 RepID=UPI0034473C64